MRQLNIRLDDEDRKRISFLTDYLRREGLLYGPTTTTGAIRFALRFTIDSLTGLFEHTVKAKAGNPNGVNQSIPAPQETTDDEKANPDRDGATGDKGIDPT